MAASSVAESDLMVTQVKMNDIPYFASQSLNTAKWPSVVSNPVGFSPARAERLQVESQFVDEWSDDEGDDAAFFAQSDDEDEFYIPAKPKSKKSTLKRIIADATAKPLIVGGRPATSKKVTADLDSEDEIIVRMKNAKYQETAIADHLVNIGKIKYNPKTIGTRWNRIKKKLAERQDELLDKDLADWHDGDDEGLREAETKANLYISQEIQKIEAKRDRYIADYLKFEKPVTNFSAKACRDRLNALKDGTAKPTPESVLNPGADTLAKIRDRKIKEERIARDQGGALDALGVRQSRNSCTATVEAPRDSRPTMAFSSGIGIQSDGGFVSVGGEDDFTADNIEGNA